MGIDLRSALAGAGALALVLGLVGFTQETSSQALGRRTMLAGLTPEQAEILGHLSIEYLDDGQGGQAKTIRFTGVNLQVVNGLDDTETVNGLGNLVLGYNEPRTSTNDRTGSHCIVVGKELNHSSYGGLILGERNWVTSDYASVLGGHNNFASEPWATTRPSAAGTSTPPRPRHDDRACEHVS